MHSETTTNVNEYKFFKNNQIMKHSFKFYLLGGAFLLGLSMCLTSCEDVLGHWEKPTPKIPEFNVTSISLNETSLVLYKDGGEKTATLTPTLVGSPGLDQVLFISSDPNIATVDEETGEVTAVDGGEAIITASIGDLKVDCEVKVYHKKHDISTGAATIPDKEQWEIIGTGANKIIIGDLATAVLNGVTITSTAGPCIETKNTGGGSNIILVDGTENTMNAAAKFAAINTDLGPLNIYGQTAGTGKLIANGGTSGAGIGGNMDGNYSSIVIMGGIIEAKGGDYAAGIGSGHCVNEEPTRGDITISGGEVTATGGEKAAGIGTGFGESSTNRASCGSIKIEKGVVSVTATMGASASVPIGKGAYNIDPYFGDITFDTVKAASAGAYDPTPTDGKTYDGLKLAISTKTNTGDTWTLTPAN